MVAATESSSVAVTGGVLGENLIGRGDEQVRHERRVVQESHDGPEVGGVAAERAVRAHADFVLEDRRRVAPVRWVHADQTARVLVPEHAAERRRYADAAADIGAQSEH